MIQKIYISQRKKNIKLNFSSDPFSPQIPTIHWDLSTKRILTMEFAEGGQVNDRDYMKTHNINVNEVWPVCSSVPDDSSDTAQVFPCFLFLF